jgi:hypothetical protein
MRRDLYRDASDVYPSPSVCTGMRVHITSQGRWRGKNAPQLNMKPTCDTKLTLAGISNTSSRSRNQRGAHQELRKERETSSAAACEFIPSSSDQGRTKEATPAL